jgi:hypothetical protein
VLVLRQAGPARRAFAYMYMYVCVFFLSYDIRDAHWAPPVGHNGCCTARKASAQCGESTRWARLCGIKSTVARLVEAHPSEPIRVLAVGRLAALWVRRWLPQLSRRLLLAWLWLPQLSPVAPVAGACGRWRRWWLAQRRWLPQLSLGRLWLRLRLRLGRWLGRRWLR